MPCGTVQYLPWLPWSHECGVCVPQAVIEMFLFAAGWALIIVATHKMFMFYPEYVHDTYRRNLMLFPVAAVPLFSASPIILPDFIMGYVDGWRAAPVTVGLFLSFVNLGFVVSTDKESMWRVFAHVGSVMIPLGSIIVVAMRHHKESLKRATRFLGSIILTGGWVMLGMAITQRPHYSKEFIEAYSLL